MPVVCLWFPYQVMAGIWRAVGPAGRRDRAYWLPGLWWACWLLAGLTSFRYLRTHTVTATSESTSVSVGWYFGETLLSKIFLIGAAVLLTVLVRKISRQLDAPLQAGQG